MSSLDRPAGSRTLPIENPKNKFRDSSALNVYPARWHKFYGATASIRDGPRHAAAEDFAGPFEWLLPEQSARLNSSRRP